MVAVPVSQPSTRRELASPAAAGARHTQIVRLAVALATQGFNPRAIYHQLRPNYAEDVRDAEITGAIAWAINKAGSTRALSRAVAGPPHSPRKSTSPLPVVEAFLRGERFEEADLWDASTLRLPEDWREDSLALIEALYEPGELVNIVTEFKESGGKARPVGKGTTLTRDEWLTRLLEHNTPQSEAGAWIRMNPTNGKGISDGHVTAWRYALVEFDSISKAHQLSLITRLPLPIAAVMTSGGRSLHAWVRVNAQDADTYRSLTTRILGILKHLGADTANKNPSRLSRLPGASRQIGALGDGPQRLLYLNPDARASVPIL